jgi:hypothetical protein
MVPIRVSDGRAVKLDNPVGEAILTGANPGTGKGSAPHGLVMLEHVSGAATVLKRKSPVLTPTPVAVAGAVAVLVTPPAVSVGTGVSVNSGVFEGVGLHVGEGVGVILGVGLIVGDGVTVTIVSPVMHMLMTCKAVSRLPDS